jgi:glycosyltransferase involved in cell wall biosynthesis
LLALRDRAQRGKSTLSYSAFGQDESGVTRAQFREHAPVLYHFPDPFSAYFGRAPRWVGTIHDLYFMDAPHEYGALARRRFSAAVGRVPAARRLFTPSLFTATQVERRFDLAGRVTVVHPGVDPALVCSRAQARDQLRRLGLTRGYLLVAGAQARRKGLDTVMRALARLRELGHALRLVVTGDPPFRAVPAAIFAETGLQPGREVLFTGWVSDLTLAALYREALALVCASVHEGFGFPVLEAFAAGTPVIAARAAALPEVAGDAALLFAPGQVPELVGAVERLLDDATLRDVLVESGLERARRFTWDQAARLTETVYQEVLGGAGP